MAMASLSRLTGLSAVLLVTLALPASAQLGRLADKAKQQAEKKAEAAAWTPATAPSFSDDVLEITAEVYGRLTTGLRAEVAAAKTAEKDAAALEKARRDEEAALAAAAKREEAADRARAARAAEREKAEAEYDRKAQAYEACIERIEEELERLTEEGERLLEQGREQEAAVVAQKARQLIESCGKPPRPDLTVDEPSEAGGTGRRTAVKTPYELVREAGERGAAMRPRPYAIVRERWINYCQTDGRPDMGFSAAELEVLGARKGECKSLLEALQKAKIPL